MPNHHTSKNSCHVTFQVQGEHFKMMDYVHKQFGVTKTKQMEYLFSHLLNYLAPENSDKDYSEEYIELVAANCPVVSPAITSNDGKFRQFSRHYLD